MKIIIPTSCVVLAVAIICSGCASLPARPDLRRNANELFDNLENEESRADNALRNPAGIVAPIHKNSERSAKDRVFRFEENGTWRMSKAETPAYAETQAENDALAKALRAAGAETYYGFNDLRGELNGTESGAVASYLQVWSKGAVEWERIGKVEFHPTQDGIICVVKIKGTVTFRGDADPAFEIVLRSGDKDLGLSRTVMKNGELVQFSAMLTKEAYLQIISVDQEQNIYLLYPNAYSGIDKLQAGEVFRFPQPGSGLELRASLPSGAAQATEALHVIATKSVPLFAEADYSGESAGIGLPVSAGKLKEVMGRLAQMKRSDWTMLVLPYQITK